MPWSKLLILKNLISEVNGSNVDPGHCNSNAGYLFSPTKAVTAWCEYAMAARILPASLQCACRISAPPVSAAQGDRDPSGAKHSPQAERPFGAVPGNVGGRRKVLSR